MDGFKVYRYYMALKLHFTSDKYNVFNNSNVRGTRDAFNSRNDRYIFEKLARRFETDYDLIQYFASNMAYGNLSVVYSNLDAEANYVLWLKRKESITKHFSDDISKLMLHLEKEKKDLSSLLTYSHDQFPDLFKLFLGDHISVETMVILDDHFNYLQQWKQFANLLWEDECRRIEKTKGFVKYDKAKILTLIQNFKEETSG